jgi:hypothetical protein
VAGLALHRIERFAEDDFAYLLILHHAHRTAGGRFSR